MSAARATVPTLERRREGRVPIHLPMVVRGTDHAGESFEERTSSVNLCHRGAAFATRQVLALGDRLEIRIPVTPSAEEPDSEFTTQGRVVYVARATNHTQLVVGVEFTGPRFNRLYAPPAAS